MNRALNAAAWLILLAIVGGVIGLGYLVYRLAENTVATIDRTWGALLLATCAVATAVGYAIERFIARYGPWIMAHADAIAAVVLTVCAVLLAVLARKDNRTW